MIETSGIGDTDKAKTTESKTAEQVVGENEKVEIQNVSVKAPSEGDVSTERMPKETLLESTKIAKVEIKIEAENAKSLVDIQDKEEGLGELNVISFNEKTCESQLENKVKAEKVDDIQEACKSMEEPSSNKNDSKNDVSEILLLDCVTETENEGNELAKQSKVQVDVIKDSDVTNEADVINEVQSDISNEVQSNVICKPAIDTKPSQVSVTFQTGGDGNPISAGRETEGGCPLADVVNLVKQSVTTETCTSPTHNDVIGNTATCETNGESKENESTVSESVIDVANEIQDQHSELADEIEDNDEDDMSLNDMVLCQPLVPQVSEAVRVGVIALVPEDNDTSFVTEESNNEVVSEENQEESNMTGSVENVDK